MRQAWMWVVVAGALLVGCEASAPTTERPERPDIETIQDAPEPTINFETYVAAGDLAVTRGQPVRAAEQYEKAIALRPKDSGVIKKLALAYTSAGQTGKSIDTWKRYLDATQNSADAYGSLGYAYELAGNPTEAEKTYKEGVARHPKGALVHINYGLMLVRRGKVDEAVTQMSAVLQPHEVNYNIASVYEQMGRKDLAQFYYRRSIECNPNFAAARQKLASVE
jgi:Tfp pilus assembly protein PilF